ncbi:MAG: glycosyltransferase family 39 protein [Actinomycetota bacterium]|nr:glycosyltransferase family 39 protein [Actinomycetota bacterium]
MRKQTHSKKENAKLENVNRKNKGEMFETRETLKRFTPTRICLAAIILSAFILFNYTNMRGMNWFVHPDDYEAYVVGKNLRENFSLVYDEPLNNEFEYPVFTHSGMSFINHRTVPTRAPGLYFAVALGLIAGKEGPFFFIPFFGLLLLFFFFKLVKLIGSEQQALISTFLIAFSAPIIYWNNMLYSNLPGVSLFVIGVYFLMKVAYGKDPRLRSYLLCSISFAFSIWMRYENVLFVFIVCLVIIIRFRYSFRIKRFLVSLLLFLLLMTPILAINNALYGSPLSFAYTQKVGTDKAAEEVAEKPEKSIWISIENIGKRFFVQDIKPNLSRVFRNAKMFLFDPFPPLAIAGVAGIGLGLLRKERLRALSLALFIIAALWTYDTCGGYHWAESSPTICSSYVRYLLIVYVVFALYVPYALEYIRSHTGRRLYRAVLTLFLVAFVLSQSFWLAGSSFNIESTTKYKAQAFHVEEIAKGLPENSIIVSTIYGKAIVSRKTLEPRRFPERKRKSLTIEYIKKLLQKGYEVYLLETPWHKASYIALRDALEKKPQGLTCEEIPFYQFLNPGDKLVRVKLAT